ncbi:MAG: 2-methoxy-6-polyprenyl-1,4-benzoquinol methylase, mitochondrial [Desulfovibrio sp.]
MAADPYAFSARWYDAATSMLLRPVRERLTARIAASGRGRVIDIGCGTGAFVAMLLEKGLDAVGVDASCAMLAEARKRLPPERAVHVAEFPLPFADGSFDAAVLCLVMHESSSGPEALLQEALRIAPCCCVVEWRMPERNLDLLAQPLVHCIERVAGKEHYARFRQFAARGYLHGVARRIGVDVSDEEGVKAGTLLIADVTRA